MLIHTLTQGVGRGEEYTHSHILIYTLTRGVGRGEEHRAAREIHRELELAAHRTSDDWGARGRGSCGGRGCGGHRRRESGRGGHGARVRRGQCRRECGCVRGRHCSGGGGRAGPEGKVGGREGEEDVGAMAKQHVH